MIAIVHRRRGRALIGMLVTVLALGLVGVYQRLTVPSRAPAPVGTDAAERPAAPSGDAAIAQAFRARRSGVWVESAGTVDRVLDDDHSGSRHQRFVVRLRDARTLLFAHNIDLARRVPVEPGSDLRFRGKYEWNDRGGTIHWTHHDPQREHAGGWIELGGRRYQ